MKTVLTTVLVLVSFQQAWADGDEGMSSRGEFDSIPTTNCTVRPYSVSSDGSAAPSPLSAATTYTQSNRQCYGERDTNGVCEGDLVAIDPYVTLRMGHRRNAQRDWAVNVTPVLGRGTQVYVTPVPESGNCNFRGGAIVSGREVGTRAGAVMTDNRTEPYSEKRCLKIEKRSDGSAIGLQISCTQNHNPVRDAERRDDAASRAGGGGGSGSGSKKAN
jgi:hypothetical protein